MQTCDTLFRHRQSCRKFTGEPVSLDALTSILEAGRLAPSAVNGQPWHFYAVTDSKAHAEVAATLQSFAAQAGAFIVVVETPPSLTVRAANHLKKHQFPQMDIGIATAQMVLQAEAQGIAQCILGWFNEKKLKRVLNVKKRARIRLVIALGQAADATVRPKKRKAREDVITYV
ncbi:MAG: NAD(P)H nitroreductase [Acholeplasmatales bacterium]|nr:MAG: NAD(P)H nitroreductase [Acholeplasmatales bacterium]